MSWNPNQQWPPQGSPNRNQRQQLQGYAPQNHPQSPRNDDGYHHDQQSLVYNDGSTQIQHHQTVSSWSSASPPQNNSLSLPPFLMPQMPQMSPMPQTQPMSMNMGGMSMSMGPNGEMNMSMPNMNMIMLSAPPPPQPVYQAIPPPPQHHQQQLGYYPNQQNAYQALPAPPPPPQQQQYQQTSPRYFPAPQSPTYQQLPQTPDCRQPRTPGFAYTPSAPTLQPLVPAQQQQSQQPDAASLAHQARTEANHNQILQAGARLDARMRELESTQARDRAERSAIDAELRSLREQNTTMASQRLADAEKHCRQLAKALANQAASSQRALSAPPPQQVQALDMSAVQKVIKETQAQQLSKADIEAVVRNSFASLGRLATKQDIEAAGGRLQGVLEGMPRGASGESVSRAVDDGLQRAIESRAGRMMGALEAQQEARMLEGARDQAMPWQQGTGRIETDFVIEEIDEEGNVVPAMGASTHASSSQGSGRARQGPPPGPPPAQARLAAPPPGHFPAPGQQSSRTAQPTQRSPPPSAPQRRLLTPTGPPSAPAKQLTYPTQPGPSASQPAVPHLSAFQSRSQIPAIEGVGTAQPPSSNVIARPPKPKKSSAQRQIEVGQAPVLTPGVSSQTQPCSSSEMSAPPPQGQRGQLVRQQLEGGRAPRQIGGATSQVVPEESGSGQELVWQSRDLSRKGGQK